MHDAYDVYDTGQPPVAASTVTLSDSLTVEAGSDCVVEYLAFANTHSGDITVTVQDGNGKTFLPGITVTAGTTEIVKIPEGGLFFSKGLKWKAGTAAKVDAWIRFRFRG